MVKVLNKEYEFTAEAFGESVARWKSSLVGAATTVENADNLFGRQALVALLSGTVTPANLAIAAYKAFAPKAASGKPAAPKLQGDTVLSVSSLRSAKGGDSARKALDALFSVHATMNGQTDADGANIMVPAVLAYINDDKGAASSPRRLADILAKAAEAEAERRLPVSDADDKADDKGDADDKADAPAEPTTLSDAILSIAAAIESADDAELEAVADEIGILWQVIADRFNVKDGEERKAA